MLSCMASMMGQLNSYLFKHPRKNLATLWPSTLANSGRLTIKASWPGTTFQLDFTAHAVHLYPAGSWYMGQPQYNINAIHQKHIYVYVQLYIILNDSICIRIRVLQDLEYI